MPVVSFVLGSYNRLPFLKLTLESIRSEAAAIDHEIIVVDGGSTDGSVNWLTQQKDVVSIIQHNRGEWRGKPINRRSWGYFMNLAFKAAQGKYILMISDDALFVPGSVQRGLDRFEQECAAGRRIGGMAFYFRDFPHTKSYYVLFAAKDKVYINHGLYLREALASVGWIDEERYRFYSADADLCLKLWQAGYEVIDNPGSIVEHYHHVGIIRTTDKTVMLEDGQTLFDRWRDVFEDVEQPPEPRFLVYLDETQTAQRFYRAVPLLSRIERYMRRQLGRMRGKLRVMGVLR
jgi:GT2 family glycosyltransferase